MLPTEVDFEFAAVTYKEFTGESPTSAGARQKIKQVASKMAEHRARSDLASGGDLTLFLPETVLQRVAETELTQRLRPQVEALRERLFGSPNAPWTHKDYQGAVQWLEDTASTEGGVPESESSRAWDIMREIRGLAEEFEALTGSRLPVSVHNEFLAHRPKPGQAVEQLPVWLNRDYPLRTLKKGIAAMSWLPGREADLVAHVLTDVPVPMPRATVSTTLPRGPMVISIHSPDVSLKELKRVYRAVRWGWGAEPERITRKISEKDEELYRLLSDEWGVQPGQPLPDGVTWRDVAKKHGGEPSADLAKKAERLRKRWKRFSDKWDLVSA